MSDLALIDAPDELATNVAACVQWSTNNVIATPADMEATADHLKGLKALMKEADAFFDGPIKQAHELHKTLVGRKKAVVEPLQRSEQIDKQKILGYQKAEAEKAAAEQRRLQAIIDEQARKDREAAEAIAAKQRQIEAEAKAKAAKALAEAAEASAAERKRLQAIADRATQKADDAAAKAEVITMEAASVVVPQVHVPTAAPIIKGIAPTTTWTYEVVDANLVPREFLVIDEKKLAAYARAMKDGAKVAGVRFFATTGISARAK